MEDYQLTIDIESFIINLWQQQVFYSVKLVESISTKNTTRLLQTDNNRFEFIEYVLDIKNPNNI